MKILVFRTVSQTHMGSIIKGVIKKFGTNDGITIICRPENSSAMNAINNVSRTLACSLYEYDFKKLSNKDYETLSKQKFDTVIIPISGNSHSYDNVIMFAKKVFGSTEIFFHQWEGEFGKTPQSKFVKYKKNILNIGYKKLVFLISYIIGAPFTLIYIITLNTLYFFRWLRTL